MNNALQAAMRRADLMTDDRLRAYPDSPLFAFARKELERISNYRERVGKFDRQFYDSINIGLMCVKELDNTDSKYCDAIYDLLERIRLDTL